MGPQGWVVQALVHTRFVPTRLMLAVSGYLVEG